MMRAFHFSTLMCAALALGTARVAESQLPRVRVVTALGDIIISVDTLHAPVTAANFLRYVDAGMYAHGRFHRTVTPDNQPNNTAKIEVIQAGLDSAQFHDFPPIPLERTGTTGLRHVNGAVSMARGGPDTATSDFFICIGAQPALDFNGARNPDGQGFGVFGQVVSGMNVVRRIQQSPAQGQTLTPAIVIVSIKRVP